MIVVTLGTISFQFDRAIEWLSIILDRGAINETVVVQHGISNVSILANYSLVTVKPMIELWQMKDLINRARFVISHAGQGSTRMLAESKASFVLLPRLKKYGEHIDDHQLWFAQAVEKFGVQHCESLEALEKFVLQPPPKFQQQLFCGPKLTDHLLTVHPARTISKIST